MSEELIGLRNEYKVLYKKDVSNNKKNDADWIKKKIEEAEAEEPELTIEENAFHEEEAHGEEEETVYARTITENGSACEVYEEGEYIRTYSKEVHGDEYKFLALQFCKKKVCKK